MSIETRVMPEVKASEILAMLEAGKSRKEIAEHFGIPTARLVKLMKSCPQLAGKKKAANPVSFVNDLVPLERVPEISHEVANMPAPEPVTQEQEQQ